MSRFDKNRDLAEPTELNQKIREMEAVLRQQKIKIVELNFYDQDITEIQAYFFLGKDELHPALQFTDTLES